MKIVCAGNGQVNQFNMTDITNTLDCMHDQQIVLIGKGVIGNKHMQISFNHRAAYGELPPGVIFRSGRVQRYVSRPEFFGGGV